MTPEEILDLKPHLRHAPEAYNVGWQDACSDVAEKMRGDKSSPDLSHAICMVPYPSHLPDTDEGRRVWSVAQTCFAELVKAQTAYLGIELKGVKS